MEVDLRETVDRLRRPEYTGENRCGLCTVVNLTLAVLLSAGIAAVAWARFEPLSAVLTSALGLSAFVAAIYFRGYLVPKTPVLTKRYAPDRILRLFEAERPEPPTTEDGDLDAEATLRRADAVTDCDRADDLCLTDGFRDAWRRRIRRSREDDTPREELSAVLGVSPGALSYDEHGDAFVAFYDEELIGRWESYAAFVADVAAADELRSRGRGWSALTVRQRSTVLQRLRAFLEACPSCGGRLRAGQEVVESCCRSTDVVAIECEDCGARLFEARQRIEPERQR
ncbi:hypothetical protein ACFQMA_16910 [Halosimplex aquaticum]|uniref:Uncharacterized protein n=1 Tax=Halosimplex aquaticum TaxID=3026162 RepID=A0ABD5Y837_9EURY|nr:hypothetical protein [Halosimplex aquaticum]